MYRYDAYDRQFVQERVAQFRDQTARFLRGDLSEDEFKPLRLMNGLYIQRHAPMLRIAIPYGLLSAEQLRMLATIARDYDKGYGHFTTRQNLQFNWIPLEQIPDVLVDLATVDMHAIQTSGNCIRNVTADQLAGVAADELEDPRPYCELIRQWSTLHPEFTFLPRKFKIAISGAEQDRAAIMVHDIGLYLVRNAAGETGFQVLVGGGLGRTPVIGKVIREFLPKRDLLSYLEAILRVYNQHGRRDNLYKARIKILVNALGIDQFRQQVEDEWTHIQHSALRLDDADIAAMQSHFTAPAYEQLADLDLFTATEKASDRAFQSWLQHNTLTHKQAGYRIVMVSLKVPGHAPGDIRHEQMERLAALADRYSFGLLRVTHQQNLVLADVKQSALRELWRELISLQLATPNIGTLNDMICCPGLDFCSLANAGSIDVAQQIQASFPDLEQLYDIGELRINISGCMNACGHHHVGNIGILGVDKNGEEWYQFTLGGRTGREARLGLRLGPAIAKDQVATAIERIVAVYLSHRENNERFVDTVDRIGIDPFKEHVYAAHH